jgi:hypothetical protein
VKLPKTEAELTELLFSIRKTCKENNLSFVKIYRAAELKEAACRVSRTNTDQKTTQPT